MEPGDFQLHPKQACPSPCLWVTESTAQPCLGLSKVRARGSTVCVGGVQRAVTSYSVCSHIGLPVEVTLRGLLQDLCPSTTDQLSPLNCHSSDSTTYLRPVLNHDMEKIDVLFS